MTSFQSLLAKILAKISFKNESVNRIWWVNNLQIVAYENDVLSISLTTETYQKLANEIGIPQFILTTKSVLDSQDLSVVFVTKNVILPSNSNSVLSTTLTKAAKKEVKKQAVACFKFLEKNGFSSHFNSLPDHDQIENNSLKKASVVQFNAAKTWADLNKCFQAWSSQCINNFKSVLEKQDIKLDDPIVAKQLEAFASLLNKWWSKKVNQIQFYLSTFSTRFENFKHQRLCLPNFSDLAKMFGCTKSYISLVINNLVLAGGISMTKKLKNEASANEIVWKYSQALVYVSFFQFLKNVSSNKIENIIVGHKIFEFFKNQIFEIAGIFNKIIKQALIVNFVPQEQNITHFYNKKC